MKTAHIGRTAVTVDFKTLIKQFPIILDGAMGTMLQSMGMDAGDVPELLNIERAEWITKIHAAYAQAGAQIIFTNTFGANRYKLEGSGFSVEDVIFSAVKSAKIAAGKSSLVALDIGPIGQLLAPTGTLTFEEAYNCFKEEVLAGVAAGADVIAFETMTDLLELKAGVLAARENSDLPIICTMSFEENGRTYTGASVSAMALTLGGLGICALGINCSLGPKQLLPLVKELRRFTDLPIIAKPNAGLPRPDGSGYDLSVTDFAKDMAELAAAGVQIFGGCCGTTPEFIESLRKVLENVTIKPAKRERFSAICSAQKTVILDEPKIIGERINPTGKKLFQAALRAGDMDYILGQALEQVRAGADILDVNVGLPDIDEVDTMQKTVTALQGITDAPLQLDSTNIRVLEAALRVYSGKAIVNSVNGEESSLATILPLVRSYGAAVVGLTLDENGIPKTAAERVAIAKKILERAEALGIAREDVYIDCLTLTASAEQDGVVQTLEAVCEMSKLGIKTVLGVSNISFGLPNRELINRTFLTMALESGLSLAILNPNLSAMTDTMRAFKLLSGYDRNSTDFVAAFSNANKLLPEAVKDGTMTLDYAVQNGLKGDAMRITKELLTTVAAMDIVEQMLLPALDRVGSAFESGEIFLPQLIQSAGASGAAFEVIKSALSSAGTPRENGGTIVLATVKGDIHDIGKNIVKVLLENYGYNVIDLGRDVPPQRVLDMTIAHHAPLVGLSALMTTTLPAMADTIALLRENHVDCKIMVGGAVLTPEYAAKIGADFYAKDAKESVDIAKKIFA